ncbi:MAG TPA: pyridoxal 5'-phosphate synthase glutaminase subunit PdxT [Methanomassiliicoccales archaeon]|nr:pyridoxal 5'-phosphate synthase glutaminase subunit PdxT [Methanomassiliicoccales archaeon]
MRCIEMKAGVLFVQGAAPEHIQAFNLAFQRMQMTGTARQVRRPKDLEGLDCLVIPGGESTTISKLLRRFGLFDDVVRMANDGVPIMGTCAGCVLLSKEGDDQVARTQTELLGVMDMQVDRNAFGRQRESFETPLDIEGLAVPFPAIFIRAPLIKRVWGGCRPLSYYGENIVMARQDNLLAMSFPPELSHDTRLHEMLISMAKH